MLGSEINPIPAIAVGFVCVSGFVVMADAFKAVGDLFDHLSAQQTTGLKGTSGLVKSLSELGSDYQRRGWGPYWGIFNGKEVIADFSSVAVTCGIAGSGKSTGAVETNCLSITHSKALTDFKGSLTCKLSGPLEARGEVVIKLNFANAFPDIIGPSDQYNPVCIISDTYSRKGGLREVGEILDEMALQLLPEPDSAGQTGNDNSYFRSASRFLIHWAVETVTLIDGEQATMADALMLLNDDELATRHAAWACGRLKITAPERPADSSEHNEETEGEGDEPVYN